MVAEQDGQAQGQERGRLHYRYEELVARAAAARKVDGVVCGHIHAAEIRELDGVTYYNDGDWVESCTARVEHLDGTMEILHWPEEIGRRNARALAALSAVDIAEAA